MCQTAEEIFDLVEKEVLDRAHQRLNLLFRNERDAIEALLRCYAKILRDLRTGKIAKPNCDARFQTANEGLRGLAQCLRWIRLCCPSALVVPSPQSAQAFHEALELLRWGVEYDPIFGEHSAYRGRLVEIDVDESTKTITFREKDGVDPHYFCSQVEAQKADDQRRAAECPEGQLALLSKTWCDSLRYSGGRLHFNDSAIRDSGAINVATKWMERVCLPELAATTLLNGCTVFDLRRVLASLYVYALFVTRLEDVTDDQPSRVFALEPRVVSGTRIGVVRWLARLSGVAEASVEAIVSTLMFDPDHPHVTLAQQPFVSSRDGHLFLLPRMLMAISLSLPKMYVGALNSTKGGQQVYSHIINEIESNGVQALADGLGRLLPNGFQTVERRTFCLGDDRNPITPDVVVLTDKNEVMAIDVKYATPPFGPLDVRRDVSEMEKWKRRMSEYVAAFQQYPDALSQCFKRSCSTTPVVFGLIVLRWPLPIPVEFEKPICAVDWPSLIYHLGKTQPNSIRQLMNWARQRPELPVPTDLAWKQKEVKAGEWTYRYFVRSSTPPSRNDAR